MKMYRKVRIFLFALMLCLLLIPTKELFAAGTTLNVTIYLHGIGKGGDSANANSVGNTSPKSTQKNFSVGVFNAQNALVVSKLVAGTYDAASGSYKATVDVGNIASGPYNVAVRSDKYLQKTVTGIQNIKSGQANTISQVSLIVGDIVVDNAINIQDYNLLMSCYADLSPAKACTQAQSVLADLTDDGSVNQLDYNLFIREISNRSGEGNPTVIPTPRVSSSPSPVPTAAASRVQPIGGPGGTWKLVFSDEFNGSALDTTNWVPNWFGEGGEVNNVKTYKANVSVTGGNLVLTLPSQGSGALVSTNPKGGAPKGFEFTTGYAEARIFFPGEGSTIYNWPAWWTSSQNWPATGEIDIAEGLDTLTTNYHSNAGANNSGTIAGTWAASYHTYAVNRQVGKSDIYWDGRLVRSVNTDDGNAPHYLILNVGSGYKGAYGSASQVKVDYVRVWQR